MEQLKKQEHLKEYPARSAVLHFEQGFFASVGFTSIYSCCQIRTAQKEMVCGWSCCAAGYAGWEHPARQKEEGAR